MTSPATILEFWFGKLTSDEDFPSEKAKMWFQEGQKHDAYIIATFGEDFERATNGEYDDWFEKSESLLALIILLDQFSRNIHRDTLKSFAQDEKALGLSLNGIKQRKDEHLRPVERVFMYMPLMHSESSKIQKQSIVMFSKLADAAPPAIEIPLRNSLDFAIRHAKIIEKFGRFPYRNDVLGRKSTKEEQSYLASAEESWF